jgi:hypothetical protein
MVPGTPRIVGTGLTDAVPSGRAWMATGVPSAAERVSGGRKVRATKVVSSVVARTETTAR